MQYKYFGKASFEDVERADPALLHRAKQKIRDMTIINHRDMENSEVLFLFVQEDLLLMKSLFPNSTFEEVDAVPDKMKGWLGWQSQ